MTSPYQPASPANKDGCGTMLVWYFRMVCYIMLVGALFAIIVAPAANMGCSIVTLLVCGGFVLLTRKRKQT